jgi:membrane associated rhomboid family serine protease
MANRRPPTFRNAARYSASFVTLLVFVELADVLFRMLYGGTLDALGIQPRRLQGLVGIAVSPLLHGDWYHLTANAVPLLILLTLLHWDRHYRPERTFAWIWIVSGLGTWAIGRSDSLHIGASGLVYGLVAYLIAAGLLMRRWRPALIALAVGLGFSGIWYGVLPQDGPVSWEGHLCGALAGAFAAKRNH